MSNSNNAVQSIADVNLWLKLRGNSDLTLADIPSILPLRWAYFRDNWNFLLANLKPKVAASTDPDSFNSQIVSLTALINSQRFNTYINPFSNGNVVGQYYFVFDQILIADISLSNEEQTILVNEEARVKAFTKNDFLKAQSNIIIYRDQLTDTYGLGDATYNTVVNRSATPTQVAASIANTTYLLQFQNSLKTIDFILANLFAVDEALDPFALARANANNPDINIGQYASGTLVRLNYGESLATLANRTLGDPNAWIDIALANGLKPPYIDEEGQALPLIANGSGNQINISGTDATGNPNIEKLYINQPLFIQSTTQVVPSQRVITSIKQIPISGEIVIELSGGSNLDQYTVINQANVRVFLPRTTNSNFYILIPSANPLPNSRKEDIPWFLTSAGNDLQQMKVDLAIDVNGDINFASNGDLVLSYGIENAIQAVRLMVITELGSLRYHPNYGLVNMVGMTNADLGALRDILVQSLTSQIASDSRFDRVEHISVTSIANSTNPGGPSGLLVQLSVRLAGGSNIVPISFTVNGT